VKSLTVICLWNVNDLNLFTN